MSPEEGSARSRLPRQEQRASIRQPELDPSSEDPGGLSRLLRGPVARSFLFHALEALVIVGELLHMRERDLSGQDRVVAGHVRLRIVGAVLELDVHPKAERLEVEVSPLDSDLVADTPG